MTTSIEREITKAGWRAVIRTIKYEESTLDRYLGGDDDKPRELRFLDMDITVNVWGDRKRMGKMTCDDLTTRIDLIKAAYCGQTGQLMALMRAYGAERVGDLPEHVRTATH